MVVRKIIAGLLSITLLAGFATGCGTSSKSGKNDADGIKADSIPEYLNATGYPIVKKPLTLKFVAGGGAALGPFEEMYVFKQMEQKSGIHIEWNVLAETGMAEKRNLMIASNELPDVFYRTKLTAKEVVTYGSQGVFIPIGSMIEKYGENLKAVITRLPDVKKAITAPNGNIYSVPAIYGYDAPKVNFFFWINTKWLSNVGMSMPTTTDEFYNVLKAFKSKDANGNGKADEIPFGGGSGSFMDLGIRGSFGLGTNGKGEYQLDKDGKMEYININPRYKDALAYMNKLYSEGLIDKEIFTLTGAKGKAKAATGVFGTVYDNNPETASVSNKEDWAGMPQLKGPYGDQVYSHGSGSMGEIAPFVITNACKYPEAALRWVDYWYGDEGTELLHGGEKGKTYIMNAQGNMEYTDFVLKNPEGLTQAQVTGKYTPFPSVPRILIEKYNAQTLNAPHVKAARSKVLPYVPKDVWNPFLYTEQELEIMNTAANDINQYFTEMQVKFITGAAPLSGWDDYVKQVKQMGLDKVLQVQQAAFERYNKVK